jgi:hypothetical protein
MRRALAAAIASLAAAPAFAQQPDLAAQVKATFLLRFGQYVDWRAGGRPADAPFVICAVGASPVGDVLGRVTAGERIANRPVVAAQFDRAPAAGTCDVVYLAQGGSDVREAVGRLGRSGALIVSDADASIARAMVHFEVRDGRVRFHIDEAMAQQAGLSISSRLLQLAVTVRRRSGS